MVGGCGRLEMGGTCRPSPAGNGSSQPSVNVVHVRRGEHGIVPVGRRASIVQPNGLPLYAWGYIPGASRQTPRRPYRRKTRAPSLQVAVSRSTVSHTDRMLGRSMGHAAVCLLVPVRGVVACRLFAPWATNRAGSA